MLFAGSATLLLSLLLWEEVANAGVALAWGILAIALIETGEEFKGLGLIGQGRLLLIAAFARIFFADLNAATRIGPVTSRTLTITVPCRDILLGRNKIRTQPMARHISLVRHHRYRRPGPLRAANFLGGSGVGDPGRGALRVGPTHLPTRPAPTVLHIHGAHRHPLRLR